jgi:hypothetical protein
MPFAIKTARELIDPELEARWARRRGERQHALLRRVWRALLARGEPVPVSALPGLTGTDPEAVRAELGRLDEEDLIVLEEGAIRLAYPFAGEPTAFSVVLPDGAERFACCAIDALGIAPMLGRRVEIRSRCHHCGAPIAFSATPEGPGAGADEVMVWVGRRAPGERRVSTGL